jgi:hypothetical protein
MDPIAQFFCALQQSWQQAVQSCPLQAFSYTIAGQGVQCHFAGKHLVERLTPALAHLRTTAPQPVTLTLYGWDSAESGIALPPLPFSVGEEQAPTNSWGYFAHDNRFRLFFQPAQQTLYLLDQAQQVAFFWLGDARQLSLADGGAPLLTLWHWWASQHGCQVVHGAAIGTATGGALLIGKSGSGKSTTALAALDAGLCYVGDDYCLVRSGAQPLLYSLFSSGKVHVADLARFPRLQALRTSLAYTNADKALFFFAGHFARTVVPVLPLKMILLPVIRAETHSSLCEISPAQALLALAPSTLFQLVGEKAQIMPQLSQLVRQLPCFRLSLGADLSQIPALIADRLATL